jgi:hypothetical protein
MNCHRRTLPVLALLCASIASLPASASEESFTLRCQSDDNFLQVFSDHAVDAARCKGIVTRALKAYTFVADRAAWKDRPLLTAHHLEFALVGDNAINVLGYAKGPNLMVMKDSYMDNPLSEGTLAHELTHIQDFRQLRGQKMPSFMFEGRALTIGQAYRLNVGQAAGDYDRQMASSAARFTSEQAAALMDNYSGRGWDNQAIGTVVVEYMRVQWNGGIADINSRLSRMIERMAAGREFEQAFQDEFGVTAEAFAGSFTGFLQSTQGDPKRRLAGTMWQSISPNAPAAGKPREDYVGAVVDIAVETAISEAIGELLR